MAFDADIGETAFSRYAGADERRIRLLEPPAAAPAPAPAGGRYWGTSSRKEPIHVVDGQLREARRVWFVFSDPQSGAGDYYRTLFQREWRRVGGHQVRGIDLGIYEGSP
jgi:hypothetical protein